MLSFVFTDIFENTLKEYPLSVRINMEEDVPADSLYATFRYFECDELKSVKVYDENVVVFTGIIDEQITESSSDGDYLKISARSLAALLLDNESVPISYNHPSCNVIEQRHLKPFSISALENSNDTYFGTHTVYKGESNYKAVEGFSKKVFKSPVRVNENGELSFKGIFKNEKVVFSNSDDGIFYHGFVENIRRCEPISKVRIKVVNSSGYHTVLENESAVKKGIVRERYLNAVLTDTPAVYAQSIIENSNKKAYSLTLKCKGQKLYTFGCDALVKDSVKGEIDNLYVSGVRYELGNSGETTVVTLKRKEV